MTTLRLSGRIFHPSAAETKAIGTLLVGAAGAATLPVGTLAGAAGGAAAVGWLALQRAIARGSPTPIAPHALRGKVVVVTGGNSGIGYHTAADAAKAGAHVVLACRSGYRARLAMDRIRQVAPSAEVSFMPLDLADPTSVHQFAEEFKQSRLPLNCLVNNAGYVADNAAMNKLYGVPEQIATNALGPWLLTSLMADRVADVSGRIVNVSSCVHRTFPVLDDPIKKVRTMTNPLDLYGFSKLVNHTMTRAFQADYCHKGVVVVSLHPGCVATEILNHNALGFVMRNFQHTAGLLFHKTAWEGAQTSLYCMAKPNIKGGSYYVDSHLADNQLSAAAKDPRTNALIKEWAEDKLQPFLKL